MSENQCDEGENRSGLNCAGNECVIESVGSSFCCKYCDKVFQHPSSLSRHVKSKHCSEASSSHAYCCHECSEK